MEVFGWGSDFGFDISKCKKCYFTGFVGKRWKLGALGITTPHPWSFSPLRGEGVRG